MKIRNLTAWRTDHLRAILQKAAENELEPAKRKVLTVTVSYTRGGYSSGCAWIGGRTAVVRIRHPKTRSAWHAKYIQVPHDDPRPGHGTWHNPDGTTGKTILATPNGTPLSEQGLTELKLRFASVAAHEFAHIRGMNHDVMPAKYKWHGRWRDYVAWAADMPLEEQARKAKAKPTVDDKLAHVRKQLARAQTRAKRATTIVKKWKAKENYYLRRAAAQAAK